MKNNISKGIKLILFIGITFQCSTAFSQTHDTLAIYKKIKKVAVRHKFTNLLYDAIFVEPAPMQYESHSLSDQQKKKDPNLKYEGKIIRSITINVLDPFGYSITDTNRIAINDFQKIANHCHATTKHRIIRNNLLFKANDVFDVYKYNESERILRNTDYVNDASMQISSAGKGNDSIDIKVSVLDRWTVDAPVNASFTSANATLIERNFLGFGQRVEQSGGYNSVNGNYQYGGLYKIGNIKRSFISSTIYYTTNQNVSPAKTDETTAVINIDRAFYSPLTKWAGGISESKTWDDNLDSVESVYQYFHTEKINSDLWLGRSLHPQFGIPVNRKGTNIILAVRYLDERYQIRPTYKADTNNHFLNSTLYLGSVAFSLRKFYKDRFIYRFGANEDIPEGALVQLLYGLKTVEDGRINYYSGFQLTYGKHLQHLGYASAFANYGSFFYPNTQNSATFNAGFYYFSNLLRIRKWYVRQFMNFKYVNGINKSPSETIGINSSEMYGFNNGSLAGNQKMILNLETVTYAPYNLIGFRFAPLILIGLGMINSPTHTIIHTTTFGAYALGVLVRNENLLNSSFQITYGFYPNLPDHPDFLGKFNPRIDFTIKVPIFAVTKPSVVSYE